MSPYMGSGQDRRGRFDSIGAGRELHLELGADPERLGWRIAMAVLIAAIALGLRPNARVLVARSLVLRSGRVDRQTLLALAAAALLAAAGDSAAYVSLYRMSTVAEIMRLFAINPHRAWILAPHARIGGRTDGLHPHGPRHHPPGTIDS